MITKIMLIIPRLDIGGAERVMMTLADHLDKKRFAVYFLILNRQGVFSSYSNPQVFIKDLQVKRVRYAVFKLIREIWTIRPRIVLSTLHHLNLLLMIVRNFFPKHIKFIAREATIPSENNKHEKHAWLINYLYKLVYHKFDKIICLSHSTKDDLITNYNVPGNKLIVINNPIDIDRIHQEADLIKQRLLDPGKINLLGIGRLDYIKGFDLLIQALALLRDHNFHLTILGGGDEERPLQGLAKNLGVEDQVTFAGFQPNPYAYMQQADLLVLTSRYEGFPNVVIEANACGLPVVAFNCPGGVHEIISENLNGWLVENGDVEQLAESIRRYASFAVDREAIIQNVQARYNVSKIVEEYENLFHQVLSNGCHE